MRLEETSGDHLVPPPHAKQGQVEHLWLENNAGYTREPMWVWVMEKIALGISEFQLLLLNRKARRRKVCWAFKKAKVAGFTGHFLSVYSEYTISGSDHTPLCMCPLSLKTDIQSKFFAELHDDMGMWDVCIF